MTIVSSDGLVSLPNQEVYGIATVRILKNAAVVGRSLDTPRHISEAAKQFGFVKGDRVIVANRDGSCKTVEVF